MLQEPSKLISTFCHFFAPIYGIFSAKIGVFCHRCSKKVLLKIFQINHFRRILPKKSIPGVKNSLKCEASLFSSLNVFLEILQNLKLAENKEVLHFRLILSFLTKKQCRQYTQVYEGRICCDET